MSDKQFENLLPSDNYKLFEIRYGRIDDDSVTRSITYFSQSLQTVEYCWPCVKFFCLCLCSNIVWIDGGQQLDDNNGKNTWDAVKFFYFVSWFKYKTFMNSAMEK